MSLDWDLIWKILQVVALLIIAREIDKRIRKRKKQVFKLMKKILGILVLGLMWFNSNAIAEEHKFKSKDIKGFNKIRISMHNKKLIE